MPPSRRQTSNPAQRLYDLLDRHHQTLAAGKGNSGIWTVWSEVLGVEGDKLTADFLYAFALIAEIERALAITGAQHQQWQYKIHSHEWVKAFAPVGSGTGQQVVDGDTSDAARAALGSIASHLRDNLPEGNIPLVEGVTSLRDVVRAAIDEVLADDTLPMQLQDLLLRRLHDALWALDHIAVTGAEGVASACDRLAMVYAWASRTPETDTDGSIWNKVKDIVVGGYALIGFGDTMYGGYQAWLAIEPYVQKAIGS